MPQGMDIHTPHRILDDARILLRAPAHKSPVWKPPMFHQRHDGNLRHLPHLWQHRHLPRKVLGRICLHQPTIQIELSLLHRQQAPLRLFALPQLPLILREKGSNTRELFERFLQRHPLGVQPKWESHCVEAIKQAVLGNQGVTVLSRRLIEESLQRGQMYILEVERISVQRHFTLVHHSDKYMGMRLQAFWAHCERMECAQIPPHLSSQ